MSMFELDTRFDKNNNGEEITEYNAVMVCLHPGQRKTYVDKSHLNRTIKSNGPTFCPFGIILSRHSMGSIILSTFQNILIIFLTLTGPEAANITDAAI